MEKKNEQTGNTRDIGDRLRDTGRSVVEAMIEPDCGAIENGCLGPGMIWPWTRSRVS